MVAATGVHFHTTFTVLWIISGGFRSTLHFLPVGWVLACTTIGVMIGLATNGGRTVLYFSAVIWTFFLS